MVTETNTQVLDFSDSEVWTHVSDSRSQRRILSLGLCGWVSTHLKKTPNNPIKHIISFSTQELNQLSEGSQVRESEKQKEYGQRKGKKGFSVYCSAAAVNKMQTMR